jgi:DNA repair exonuclease SbcCD ATPase subunit
MHQSIRDSDSMREQNLRRKRRLARKKKGTHNTKVQTQLFTGLGNFPVQFPVGSVEKVDPVATNIVPHSLNPPGTSSVPVVATGGHSMYTSGFHPSSQALLSGKFGSRTAPAETSTPAKANERAMNTLFTQKSSYDDFMKTTQHSVQTSAAPVEQSNKAVKDLETQTKDLETQTKDLESQAKNLDKCLQKNTLSVNRFHEDQKNTNVQLRNFQHVLDRLQQELQKTKVELADIKQRDKTPSKWMYGQAIHKQALYRAPKNSAVSTEFIEAGEQVLLLYPLVHDDGGRMWITARRLFENGTIDDYYTPFYAESALRFNNLTFSSVSGT